MAERLSDADDGSFNSLDVVVLKLHASNGGVSESCKQGLVHARVGACKGRCKQGQYSTWAVYGQS